MAFNETKVSDIKVYQLPQSVYDSMFAAGELDENAFYLTTGAGADLPAVGTADEGKFLRVVNGVWTAVIVTNAEEVSY